MLTSDNQTPMTKAPSRNALRHSPPITLAEQQAERGQGDIESGVFHIVGCEAVTAASTTVS